MGRHFEARSFLLRQNWSSPALRLQFQIGNHPGSQGLPCLIIDKSAHSPEDNRRLRHRLKPRFNPADSSFGCGMRLGDAQRVRATSLRHPESARDPQMRLQPPKTAGRQEEGVRGELGVRQGRAKNVICAERLVGQFIYNPAGAWAGSKMGSGFPIWKKPELFLGDDHEGPLQSQTRQKQGRGRCETAVPGRRESKSTPPSAQSGG